MGTRKSLAITLSRLKRFEKPKIKLEQYSTESEIAATVLWDAFMKGDIEGKTIADLGAGTGILGIGALLLGAKKVYFVEIDKDAIVTLKQNLESLEIEEESYEIIEQNIEDFNKEVDTVIQNPPFGTKQKHADKPFLEKAFSIAKTIYSLHKTSTDAFVTAIAKDHNVNITQRHNLTFPLRNTAKFHKKKLQRIEVTCYRFVSATSV